MQDYYDRQIFQGRVDSTQLSFVGTIGFSFCGLMGPVNQFITSKIGTRWVMFIGSLLMSIGLILASFSEEVRMIKKKRTLNLICFFAEKY